MEKELYKPVQRTSVKYQFLAAFVVNLLMIGYGVVGGWSSPSILLLMSSDSPLPSGKITMDQASWIASLLCIGGLIGNLLFGFIANVFGRKMPLVLISIPAIISWLLIWFAQNVYYLYAARTLSGIVGGGIFILIPLYLSEIASDSVRGVLGSTLILANNIGMMLAFTIGTYCDFFTTPKIVIAITAIFAVSICFLPETPSFLMKQNKISEADKSIRFYQNLKGNSGEYEILQSELKKLKETVGGDEKDKLNDNALNASRLASAVRKAFLIGIVLAALNQFCGCFAMLNYTASIFKEAGSSLTPNMSTIVIGIIQFLGSYFATILVDRTGRKFLFMASTTGTALGLITMGVYMMLRSWGYPVDAHNWIPVVSFSFVIFIASWAILTLPFLVISEIMPQHLKEFGVSFCMSLLWTFSFIMVKFLPLMKETLGFHGTMFLFAAFCIASSVFIMVFMPETKGKSYEQIMNDLQ